MYELKYFDGSGSWGTADGYEGDWLFWSWFPIGFKKSYKQR